MEFTIKKNKSFFIFLFFSAIFVIGVNIYKDYGLNIDDEWYKKNGDFYYEYIKIFLSNSSNDILLDVETLSNKIIGFSIPYMNPVLFELPHVFISKFIGFNDTKETYELAHFINFTIFFISLIYFYKLISKKFNSNLYGIFSVLILFSTPRIFAESFYNSR